LLATVRSRPSNAVRNARCPTVLLGVIVVSEQAVFDTGVDVVRTEVVPQ
jgi:hypothetical protein